MDGDATILAILGNTFALLNEIEMADFATAEAAIFQGASGRGQLIGFPGMRIFPRGLIRAQFGSNDSLKFDTLQFSHRCCTT